MLIISSGIETQSGHQRFVLRAACVCVASFLFLMFTSIKLELRKIRKRIVEIESRLSALNRISWPVCVVILPLYLCL